MDYTRTCWSCGKDTMVHKGGYYQCSECGATYNELPLPRFEGMVVELVEKGVRDTKYRPYRRRPRTGVGKR